MQSASFLRPAQDEPGGVLQPVWLNGFESETKSNWFETLV